MKLDQWLKPNAFSLALPDTWTMTELPQSMELISQGRDAAVQVSLYNKAVSGKPTAAEARALVDHFAAQNHFRADGEVASSERDFGWQCFGAYQSQEAGSMPKFWVVAGYAGAKRMAVASLSCEDLLGASFAEGQEILRSLALL